MNNRKAIICDMDGLLLDSERPFRDAWLNGMKKRGFDLSLSDYSQFVGLNQLDLKKGFSSYFGKHFPYEEISSEVEIVLNSGNYLSNLKDGVLDFLKMLHADNVPCGVATSTWKHRAQDRLRKAGIFSSFRTITGSDEVLKGKPSPDIFLLVAQKLGVQPNDCLVLEDSCLGAFGAKQAGMSVIVIPDLKDSDETVKAFALGIFNSLAKATPTVRQWLAAPCVGDCHNGGQTLA